MVIHQRCIEVDHTTLRYWGFILLLCAFVAWILSQAFYEGWLADVNPVWTNTCIPWPGFDQSILCLCLTKQLKTICLGPAEEGKTTSFCDSRTSH